VTPDDVRALALALPEVAEAGHHGRPSFRLGGSILATLWDDGALDVVLGESEARAAEGGAVSMLWWGQRLSGVRIELAAADEALVGDLLEEAWTRRAPARLRRRDPPPA
jgi:hypothetical protein